MLKKLFEGVDGLNDELLTRMEPMFEAAVEQKVQLQVKAIAEAHSAEVETLRDQLVESAAVNNEERARIMAEKMDTFLERVVGQWINENAKTVQDAALGEAAGVFLAQLAEAASNFNSVIPEAEKPVVEGLNQQIQRLEARLNDTIKENVQLRESEIRTKKLVIAGRVAEGMSDLGKERLKEAALSASYRDPKQFKALVESHRLIIEGGKNKAKPMDEDDLFDDGKEKKSKQKDDGTMGEKFVDGTDKDYPLNIKEKEDDDEDDDFFNDKSKKDEGYKGKKKNESDDEDQDDEDEEEKDGKKKPTNESVDLSAFGNLLRPR